MFDTDGFNTPNYFWLNLAYLTEWIFYFIISFVELIAWILAMNGYPMYLVVWAYICLWGSIFLYGLPVIFIIIHSVDNGTEKTVNWTTDGGLPHLIIDIFLWVLTAVFHYFFYPSLVFQHAQQLQGKLDGVFSPANYQTEDEKRKFTSIKEVRSFGGNVPV